MKKIFLIVGFMGFLMPCFAQSKIKDSLFVRIDQLKPSKLKYQLNKGDIIGIDIFIQNKYDKTAGFMLANGKSDLALIIKKKVEKRVISYSAFNNMLNRDFRNIWAYTQIYFILSESRTDYLVLEVRPILPGQLDIQ